METPITYQALAKALQLSPPNTINQISVALEHLIEEDTVSGNPLIAALVVSKARQGLPAPGFFESAQRCGRTFEDAPTFFASEYDQAVKFWCKLDPTGTEA